MSASLPPSIKYQPIVGGLPLPGGKVKFFQAGTTTPQAVYAGDGVTPIGTEVVLDADGTADFRLGDGLLYKVMLEDGEGIPVPGWTQDKIKSTDQGPQIDALSGRTDELSERIDSGDAAIRGEFKAADGAATAAAIAREALMEALITSEFEAADTALSSRIGAVEVGQSAAVIGYDTQASLFANLVPADKAVAYVMNDSTPANNGTYRKSGASGAGSWIQSSYDRVALTESKITDLDMSPDFVVGCNAQLHAVRQIRINGANPLKFYFVKLLAYLDSGTRITTVISQADDAAGTGSVDVCSYYANTTSYTGVFSVVLSELSGSGITAIMTIDRALMGASIAIYSGAYATTGVKPQALVPVVTIGAATFVDTLANDYLRQVVKNVWLYGCDPSHDYIISFMELQSYRVQFIIKDLTTNTQVAQAGITKSIPDFNALPKFLHLGMGNLGAYSGVTANIELDWSQAVVGTNTYTTMDRAGIHKSHQRADTDIMDYLDRDVFHEIIPIGAGQTYTTIDAAVTALLDQFDTISGANVCARACYDHQILLDLVDYGATYNVLNVYLPPFVSIRGLGIDKTFITNGDASHHSLLQMYYEGKIKDCTLISNTGDGGAWAGEYCIHSDDFNRVSTSNKRRRIRQLLERVKLIGGPNNKVSLWGSGISSGQVMRFKDVQASHFNVTATAGAFSAHNTGATASTLPHLMEFIGCKSTDAASGGMGVLSLGGGVKGRCTIIDCEFERVYQGVTGSVADKAADRYEWEFGGNYEGPFVQADAGMVVLKTAAGQTPTGTAAAVIFGTMDELGRGDLCIENGTSKSLGARLGDCSVVNKALTIGGQTYTFNANHTAQSNATIIGLINSALTTYPVSEKNIQYEFYPDTGFTRRMLNSTGATIAAGKFVKRTGTNTIALADGTDDIFGFVYRDILNGLAGNVVISKKIHTAYLTGASSDGKFGVTAGLVDYGAATKKGYVIGAVAHLY